MLIYLTKSRKFENNFLVKNVYNFKFEYLREVTLTDVKKFQKYMHTIDIILI